MIKLLRFRSKETGFTLLEVVIAIFIITVAVISIITVIFKTYSYINIAKRRLTAAYLAQEGIEIIRNIRDTNWLEYSYLDDTNPWYEKLNTCCSGAECVVDYTDTAQLDFDLRPWTGQYLNIDANGLYSYLAGTPTKLKRKITTECGPIGSSFAVKADVFWEDELLITVQEKLYDWR